MTVDKLKERLAVIESQLHMLNGGREEIKFWMFQLEEQARLANLPIEDNLKSPE